STDHRDLHSFPTRRSSDLALGRASRIVPSRTIASSLGLGSGDLLVERMGCRPWNAPEGAPPSGPGSHGNACTRALQVRDLADPRSEEHTSELQSLAYLVCR